MTPCTKRFVHDWVTCPLSHPGEKAKRRDPRKNVYTGIACPAMKKVSYTQRMRTYSGLPTSLGLSHSIVYSLTSQIDLPSILKQCHSASISQLQISTGSSTDLCAHRLGCANGQSGAHMLTTSLSTGYTLQGTVDPPHLSHECAHETLPFTNHPSRLDSNPTMYSSEMRIQCVGVCPDPESQFCGVIVPYSKQRSGEGTASHLAHI